MTKQHKVGQQLILRCTTTINEQSYQDDIFLDTRSLKLRPRELRAALKIASDCFLFASLTKEVERSETICSEQEKQVTAQTGPAIRLGDSSHLGGSLLNSE